MAGRLVQLWRIAALSGVFACFCVCVVFTSLVLTPLLRWTHRDARKRARRLRSVLGWACRQTIAWSRRFGVIRVSVEGADALRSAHGIVVANHPTAADALVLLGLMDDGVCVTSARHWDRPVGRRIIREAGYPFDTDGVAVVDACVERVREGASVLVFPEGTRSRGGRLQPLARGAAHVALRTGRDLLPVVVYADPPILSKDLPWTQALAHRIEYRVSVQPPIPVADVLRDGTPRPVAARLLTAAVREVFEKNLERVRA